jgi:hypothetical protein
MSRAVVLLSSSLRRTLVLHTIIEQNKMQYPSALVHGTQTSTLIQCLRTQQTFSATNRGEV